LSTCIFKLLIIATALIVAHGVPTTGNFLGGVQWVLNASSPLGLNGCCGDQRAAVTGTATYESLLVNATTGNIPLYDFSITLGENPITLTLQNAVDSFNPGFIQFWRYVFHGFAYQGTFQLGSDYYLLDIEGGTWSLYYQGTFDLQASGYIDLAAGLKP